MRGLEDFPLSKRTTAYRPSRWVAVQDWDDPLLPFTNPAEFRGHDLFAGSGRPNLATALPELRGTFPFLRSQVDDVITDPNHHIAVLDIDLKSHCTACQCCQLLGVGLGKTGHLQVFKTVRTGPFCSMLWPGITALHWADP